MPKFIYINEEQSPDAYAYLIESSIFTEALLWNPNAYGEVIQSPTFTEATLGSTNATGELINSPTFVEGILSQELSQDPFFSNVVLFLKGDGINNSTSIVDSSPNPKIINRFGNTQISTVQSKYGSSSILFDGNGDYLTTPALNLFNIDFTVEYWIYNLSQKFGVVLSSYNLPYQVNTFITHTHSEGYIRAQNGINNEVNTPVISLNTWNHVAITYRHSLTEFKIYLNGILTQTKATGGVTSQDFTLWVGGVLSDNNTSTWWLHAYLDSLRVTRGIIRYTTNFNPETDTYLN